MYQPGQMAGLSHMSKELEEEVIAPHGGALFSADGFGRGVQAQDVLGQSSDDGEVLGRGLGAQEEARRIAGNGVNQHEGDDADPDQNRDQLYRTVEDEIEPVHRCRRREFYRVYPSPT